MSGKPKCVSVPVGLSAEGMPFGAQLDEAVTVLIFNFVISGTSFLAWGRG